MLLECPQSPGHSPSHTDCGCKLRPRRSSVWTAATHSRLTASRAPSHSWRCTSCFENDQCWKKKENLLVPHVQQEWCQVNDLPSLVTLNIEWRCIRLAPHNLYSGCIQGNWLISIECRIGPSSVWIFKNIFVVFFTNIEMRNHFVNAYHKHGACVLQPSSKCYSHALQSRCTNQHLLLPVVSSTTWRHCVQSRI